MDHCYVILMFHVCYVFLSVYCSHVVTCWERADLFSLLCVVFSCVFVNFPCGVLGHVWYLILSILIFPFLLILNPFIEQGLFSWYAERKSKCVFR